MYILISCDEVVNNEHVSKEKQTKYGEKFVEKNDLW